MVITLSINRNCGTNNRGMFDQRPLPAGAADETALELVPRMMHLHQQRAVLHVPDSNSSSMP